MQAPPTVLSPPPTEVPAKAAGRTFTADYKRRILREVEACKVVTVAGMRLHHPARSRHRREPGPRSPASGPV